MMDIKEILLQWFFDKKTSGGTVENMKNEK